MQTKFSQRTWVSGVCGRALLIAYILMIQFAGAAVASSVSLAWDPNSESSLAGYNIYRSNQSGSYPSTPLNRTPLQTTSFTDSPPTIGTYYYTVRAVSVSGQESASSNQVQVTLNAPPPVNSPPVVSAGPNQTITLPASTMLTATATDDGFPSPLTYTWSMLSGTGVTLTNPNSSSTQVSFSAAGTYILRVTVSDGQLSATADVVVTVNANNQGSGQASGPLKATFLGITGQDYVGPGGQLTPDGVPDWHIQLQGLRSNPVAVRIISTAGGHWVGPYDGNNWVISAQWGASGTGDLWFEPYSTPGFHIKVWYSD